MSAEKRRPDARELLDRAPEPGEREAWARHYAKPPERGAERPERAFVFRLGAEWLALPAGALAQAAAPRPAHSIPHRRDGALAGLVNIDGELLPCVRLERVLGIEPSAKEEPAKRILVMNTPVGRAAFVADQVHGTLAYDAALLRPAPSRPACARAVFSWAEKTVGLLDVAALGARVEGSLA